MKITEIRPYHIQDPDGWGRYFVVKVLTDAGISGLGEVGIHGRARSVAAAIEHLSQLLIGADPWETERLWQEMFRRSFYPADTVYTSAISAIDIALWDIKARSVEMPLHRLLGGPVRDKVICYPHAGGQNVAALVDSCRAFADGGWKFVRYHLPATGPDYSEPGLLEPREALKSATESMFAIREALPDIEICLDMHTRVDTTHAIQICEALAPAKPYFIEDPIRSENPGSYRKLSSSVTVPIAAGEQWGSKWGFREVLENEWIDYARIDLCIAGGITESLKIAHWAETHYIDIVPHNPLGPVSSAAGVHLCMASTNVGVQEMPRAPGTFAQRLFPKQLRFDDGYAFADDSPGLGVEMDEELAMQQRVTEPDGFVPMMRRNDGAFTNW